jgi:predicted nucleotidyltransferase
MRQRNYEALPPMNLLEMLDQTDISDDARTAILELVETKKVTREMGEGVPPAPVYDFIAGVDARYKAESIRDFSSAYGEAEEIAGAFYREEVGR